MKGYFSPIKNHKRVSLIPANSYVHTLLCLIVGGSNGKLWEKKLSSSFIIISKWPKHNPGIFGSTFLVLVNGSKYSILNWVFKLNLFFAFFSKTWVINILIMWNYKANYLLPKPIISACKFCGTLLGPIHCMFHHCSSLDL